MTSLSSSVNNVQVDAEQSPENSILHQPTPLVSSLPQQNSAKIKLQQHAVDALNELIENVYVSKTTQDTSSSQNSVTSTTSTTRRHHKGCTCCCVSALENFASYLLQLGGEQKNPNESTAPSSISPNGNNIKSPFGKCSCCSIGDEINGEIPSCCVNVVDFLTNPLYLTTDVRNNFANALLYFAASSSSTTKANPHHIFVDCRYTLALLISGIAQEFFAFWQELPPGISSVSLSDQPKVVGIGGDKGSVVFEIEVQKNKHDETDRKDDFDDDAAKKKFPKVDPEKLSLQKKQQITQDKEQRGSSDHPEINVTPAAKDDENNSNNTEGISSTIVKSPQAHPPPTSPCYGGSVVALSHLEQTDRFCVKVTRHSHHGLRTPKKGISRVASNNSVSSLAVGVQNNNSNNKDNSSGSDISSPKLSLNSENNNNNNNNNFTKTSSTGSMVSESNNNNNNAEVVSSPNNSNNIVGTSLSSSSSSSSQPTTTGIQERQFYGVIKAASALHPSKTVANRLLVPFASLDPKRFGKLLDPPSVAQCLLLERWDGDLRWAKEKETTTPGRAELLLLLAAKSVSSSSSSSSCCGNNDRKGGIITVSEGNNKSSNAATATATVDGTNFSFVAARQATENARRSSLINHSFPNEAVVNHNNNANNNAVPVSETEKKSVFVPSFLKKFAKNPVSSTIVGENNKNATDPVNTNNNNNNGSNNSNLLLSTMCSPGSLATPESLHNILTIFHTNKKFIPIVDFEALGCFAFQLFSALHLMHCELPHLSLVCENNNNNNSSNEANTTMLYVPKPAQSQSTQFIPTQACTGYVHNDLHSGNILVHLNDRRICLCDFEHVSDVVVSNDELAEAATRRKNKNEDEDDGDDDANQVERRKKAAASAVPLGAAPLVFSVNNLPSSIVSSASPFRITPRAYTPPELVSTPKRDVWAATLICFELFLGICPVVNALEASNDMSDCYLTVDERCGLDWRHFAQLLRDVVVGGGAGDDNDEQNNNSNKLRRNIFLDFCSKGLANNPKNRATAEEMLSHPFLSKKSESEWEKLIRNSAPYWQ